MKRGTKQGRSQRRPKKQTLSFLIATAQIARLARLTGALKARYPGSQLTRADAARAALHVGLEKLEREMGISASE